MRLKSCWYILSVKLGPIFSSFKSLHCLFTGRWSTIAHHTCKLTLVFSFYILRIWRRMFTQLQLEFWANQPFIVSKQNWLYTGPVVRALLSADLYCTSFCDWKIFLTAAEVGMSWMNDYSYVDNWWNTSCGRLWHQSLVSSRQPRFGLF